MANPTLNEKRFKDIAKEDEAGWAAPEALARAEASGAPAGPTRVAHMTANGAFAKTFVLFLFVLAGGAVGWSQTTISSTGHVEIPVWAWVSLFVAFGLALVCVFRPKASPILAPLYAIVEGLFLGAISKAFEVQWDGIVFQAVLAVVGVFFATLALYVFGVVKVTRRFQMIVIGATFGILLLYVFGRAALVVRRRRGVLEPAERDRHRGQCCDLLRRVVEPVPRLRVHPPVVDQRRAEVHGVVQRVRDHGHAGVDLPGDAAPALTVAALDPSHPRSGVLHAHVLGVLRRVDVDVFEHVEELRRGHHEPDPLLLEHGQVGHRSTGKVAQHQLAVDALARFRLHGLVERHEEWTGVETVTRHCGQELVPELLHRVRRGYREGAGDVADDLDDRDALARHARVHVVPLARELEVGKLLRFAVGLATRRHGGLEVDGHHRAELAELIAVHRLEQERADDLVQVTVDLDTREVHADPRLGGCRQRRRQHLREELRIREVRDLEPGVGGVRHDRSRAGARVPGPNGSASSRSPLLHATHASVSDAPASSPVSQGRPAFRYGSHLAKTDSSVWPRSSVVGPIRSAMGRRRSASKP